MRKGSGLMVGGQTVEEFSRVNNRAVKTVRRDMRKGFCEWPRKTPKSDRLAAAHQYSRWKHMIGRCYQPLHPDYPNYGGRGIRVYSLWYSSLTQFATWLDTNLGPCPEGWSLDRINVDGDYVPGNLRWASASTQAFNRRKSKDHGLKFRKDREHWCLSLLFKTKAEAEKVRDYAVSIRNCA